MKSLSFRGLLALLLIHFNLQGQDSVKVATVTRFLEVGGIANSYRGDLHSQYRGGGASFQVGLKMHFKKRLNGRVSAEYGTLSSSQYGYRFDGEGGLDATPNDFFRTNFFSLGYNLQVNLVKRERWWAYAGVGVGLLRFSPKDAGGQSLTDQTSTRPSDETYSPTALTLPLEIGAAGILPNGYGLTLGVSLLNPQTDYLDNLGNWGNRAGNDNALRVRFAVLVPVSWEPKPAER